MSTVMTLVQRLRELGNKRPDACAIAFRDETISYRGLAALIDRAAAELVACGLAPGDVVFVAGVSRPESVVCYLAAQACGCTAVFFDKLATSAALETACDLAKPKIVVASRVPDGFDSSCRIASPKELLADQGKSVSAVTTELPALAEDAEKPAEILFTTGTTGIPKAVVLSLRAVRAIALNTIEGVGITPDDTVLVPLPINHSLALRVMRAVLWQGATLVLQSGFSFPRETEKNILERGCTGLVTVPAALDMDCSRFGNRFADVYGKLRYLEIGAGALPEQKRLTLVDELPDTRLISTWGSSETGGVLFAPFSEVDRDSSAFSASGLPVSGAQVAMLDEKGSPFPSSEAVPGRLALRGDMLTSGYLANPELTESSFADGWFVTSDLAFMDDAGFVHVVGRADDVINVGGEKVSPHEIERALSRAGGVKECACVGVDDPDGSLGQIPVVFAVSDGGDRDEESLRASLLNELERYKMPHAFVWVNELPRNRMMKLDRLALREIWEKRASGAAVSESSSVGVIEAVLTRRSVRLFTDEPIARDVLESVLEAGRHAPSGRNVQSWRFTVLDRSQDIGELKAATIAAAESAGVRVYGFNNPAAVVIVSNRMSNRTGCQDCSCAAENMLLVASAMGLGAVWINALMDLRDVEPVKSLLDGYGVPADHVVWAMIALGHPAEKPRAPRLREGTVRFVSDKPE